MTSEEATKRAIERFGEPYDVFGRPYTKETYLWWRSLSNKQREQMLAERTPLGGVERLLKEYGRKV